MPITNPQRNIEQFHLNEGMSVADFGAGIGHHTVPAALAVGEEGIVYAVDVQKELLERLKKSAREEQGIENIEIVWGDVDEAGGSKLSDASVERVLLTNVLYLLEKRAQAVREIKRVLKPKGCVLVVDWSDSHGGIGPAKEQVVTEEEARALFEHEGFQIEERIDAGEHHYGFIARKKNM